MLWNQISNYHCIWLSGRSSNNKCYMFFILEPWVCQHMNYWKKCFPIVLMCWIQISNHFCFWMSERSSNIKQYVFLLCEPSFCHCYKVGGNKFLLCESIWITERECFPAVLMCRIQISNHFCFWWSGRSSNIKQYGFLLCEPSFCHCCKVGWKLVSGVWEYMNYWKRVLSNCFDMLKSIIKHFCFWMSERSSNLK